VRRRVRSALDLGCGAASRPCSRRPQRARDRGGQESRALDFTAIQRAAQRAAQRRVAGRATSSSRWRGCASTSSCAIRPTSSPRSPATRFATAAAAATLSVEEVVRRAPAHLEEVASRRSCATGRSGPSRNGRPRCGGGWEGGGGGGGRFRVRRVAAPRSDAGCPHLRRRLEPQSRRRGIRRRARALAGLFQEIGVAAVGMAGSSSAGAPRRRTGCAPTTCPATRPEPCGEQIQHIFRVEDYLRTLGDDARLLDRAFSVAEGQRLRQTLVPREPNTSWRRRRSSSGAGSHSEARSTRTRSSPASVRRAAPAS